jgi:hypothetical protein
MVAVVVVLGQLLSLDETLSHLGKHLIAGAEKLPRNLRPSHRQIHRQDI